MARRPLRMRRSWPASRERAVCSARRSSRSAPTQRAEGRCSLRAQRLSARATAALALAERGGLCGQRLLRRSPHLRLAQRERTRGSSRRRPRWAPMRRRAAHARACCVRNDRSCARLAPRRRKTRALRRELRALRVRAAAVGRHAEAAGHGASMGKDKHRHVNEKLSRPATPPRARAAVVRTCASRARQISACALTLLTLQLSHPRTRSLQGDASSTILS